MYSGKSEVEPALVKIPKILEPQFDIEDSASSHFFSLGQEFAESDDLDASISSIECPTKGPDEYRTIIVMSIEVELQY